MKRIMTFAPDKLTIALLITVAVGIVLWIYQLINGLAVTGMSNITSWGLYITSFMFFVGLSAGGLIVASSAHVFNIESFKKVALPAVICSTVCICCAAAFILIDLGGIQRIWRMLIGPNFLSPLVWDMCVITIYLIINILDIVWICRGEERKVELLSRIALPVAILVHSVTAWIFGLEIAREGWYSAIMAPIFVASACDSGLALLILSLMGLEKAQVFETGEKLFSSFGKLLATFIAVDAFFIGCELITVAYPGTEAGNAILAHMFTGATAPFFWFEIIGGLAVPFCLLFLPENRRNKKVLGIACGLVVAGVFCKRVWLLFTSFITPNLYGAPGVSLGTFNAQGNPGAMWLTSSAYLPTIVEIIIVVAVIALGILAWFLLSDRLLARGERAKVKAAVSEGEPVAAFSDAADEPSHEGIQAEPASA